MLDYFVVSTSAEAATRTIQVRYDVPTVPHKPVRLIMDDAWAQIITLGLKAAPPISNIRLTGPAAKPPSYGAARSLALDARWYAAHGDSRRMATKKLFRATQAWSQLAAEEVASAAQIDPADVDPTRYGRTPGLKKKKVLPRQSRGHTTRLRQAYDVKWCREAAGQLCQGQALADQGVRQQEASRARDACQQRMAQVPREEDGSERRMLERLHFLAAKVAAQADPLPAEDRDDLAELARQQAPDPSAADTVPGEHDDSPEAAREASWRHWAAEATARGGAEGHAWTKPPAAWQPTIAHHDGAATSAPQTIAHRQEDVFAKKWQATHDPVAAEPLPPKAQRATLARLTPDQIRDISRAFPKKTAYGTDGIHVTQYAWLCEAALECFSTIIQAMELGRRPQPQWRTMKTPLIPKKEAGIFERSLSWPAP